MPRTDGHLRFGCPHCGKMYQRPNHIWVDFSYDTLWSDGRIEGARHLNYGLLRMCTCGKAFHLREALDGGKTSAQGGGHEALAAVGMSRIDIPAFLRRRKDRPSVPAGVDIDLQASDELPVKNSEIAMILRHQQNLSPTLEIELRRRLWQYTNERLLNEFANRLSHAPETFQKMREENLIRLHTLCHTQARIDFLEIAEIERSLGWFDRAIETLSRAPEEQAAEAAIVSDCIREQSIYAVRFK